MQVAIIAALCTPPALVLILSWLMVVVVGYACCCCIPIQMLVLSFAPYTLTFAPCACSGCHWQQLTVVVFLPQSLAQTIPLHTWWFYPLQLASVAFYFYLLEQIPYLHSSNLHFTVVVFGGGGGICNLLWWWWLCLYKYTTTHHPPHTKTEITTCTQKCRHKHQYKCLQGRNANTNGTWKHIQHG